MFGEVEVGHDEPHKDDDGAKTKQVEGDLLEEGHVKHVGEDADAIVVPILEHRDKSDILQCYLRSPDSMAFWQSLTYVNQYEIVNLILIRAL